MTSKLSLFASILCLVIGLAAVWRRQGGVAGWSFLAGMFLLAIELQLDQWVITTGIPITINADLRKVMLVRSLIPLVWLVFALVYARGNGREFLHRWKWILVAGLVVPGGLLLGFPEHVLENSANGDGSAFQLLGVGKLWVISMLLLTLGVLVNLEQTFRASVGMSRWRIKYLFLGMVVIFGVKLYNQSQILLFSSYQPALANLGVPAVILGCLLIMIGHVRSGFADMDLYPSRTVLQGSLTGILAGAYFLIVGVLAQLVAMMGGTASFPAKALVILVGIVGLAMLLLSDRFRTGLQRFVSRHFRRDEHDYRKIWTLFTKRISSVMNTGMLGVNAGEVISENFHVLGVTVFQVTMDPFELVLLSATERHQEMAPLALEPAWIADLMAMGRPFDLETAPEIWADRLRERCPRTFDHGGDRLVIPLVAAERLTGLVVLADRVNGVPYTHEEIDLLTCIGDQLAAALLNASLTEKVLQAKEIEAFQTLSTFFVHDLKNAANSLNLTLQNMPLHFDDPEFRADAIRAVGRTVERINQMILKLGSLRNELQIRREPGRLDLLCGEVLAGLKQQAVGGPRLEWNLQAVPECRMDRDAMCSVVTNLVINALEATDADGRVEVETFERNGDPGFSVTDEGCGMSADFLKNQLYRPFYSTKTKGLGIGMFQCKKIVEAHQGSITVRSSPGSGTCFTVLLPSAAQPARELLPT